MKVFENLMRNKTVSNVVRKGKAQAPRAMVIGGIGLMIGGTVYACVQTTKFMSEVGDNLDALDELRSEEERDGKAITHEYAEMAKKGVKVYLKPAVLVVGGAGMTVFGHELLAKRYAAMVGAYALLDAAYSKYRQRVVEYVGEETEKIIRYGGKTVTGEIVETDKKGKEKVIEATELVYDDEAIKSMSPYARIFDESCRNWTNDPIYNQSFLLGKQAQLNDRLLMNGYVFLNEVYDEIGLPRSEAGNLVGWDRDNGIGVIDFGLFNTVNERARAFHLGYEPSVWLDFNNDGVIIDRLPKY